MVDMSLARADVATWGFSILSLVAAWISGGLFGLVWPDWNRRNLGNRTRLVFLGLILLFAAIAFTALIVAMRSAARP